MRRWRLAVLRWAEGYWRRQIERDSGRLLRAQRNLRQIQRMIAQVEGD